MAEKIEHVAAGQGVVILPSQATEDYRRDGVAYLPVADLPESRVMLAWPEDGAAPLAREAADVALEAFAHLRA
jgi:DNA-binding transcriptional LysR family regulator